ncbi:Transcription factor TGA6, partial [Cucurbita argyrosperma subsp. argyrosperma]
MSNPPTQQAKGGINQANRERNEKKVASGMPGGRLSVFERVGRLGGSFKTRKLDEQTNQALTNLEVYAMADGSPGTDISTDVDTDDKNQRLDMVLLNAAAASDSSDRTKDKSDQKTLRRLAQNREAARKSRLRKKAYVQQLESSRLKLTQLEQELQRARQQGIFISSSGDQAHSMAGNGTLTISNHDIYFHETT